MVRKLTRYFADPKTTKQLAPLLAISLLLSVQTQGFSAKTTKAWFYDTRSITAESLQIAQLDLAGFTLEKEDGTKVEPLPSIQLSAGTYTLRAQLSGTASSGVIVMTLGEDVYWSEPLALNEADVICWTFTVSEEVIFSLKAAYTANYDSSQAISKEKNFGDLKALPNTHDQTDEAAEMEVNQVESTENQISVQMLEQEKQTSQAEWTDETEVEPTDWKGTVEKGGEIDLDSDLDWREEGLNLILEQDAYLDLGGKTLMILPDLILTGNTFYLTNGTLMIGETVYNLNGTEEFFDLSQKLLETETNFTNDEEDPLLRMEADALLRESEPASGDVTEEITETSGDQVLQPEPAEELENEY